MLVRRTEEEKEECVREVKRREYRMAFRIGLDRVGTRSNLD